MGKAASKPEQYAWAGPALFISVLALLFVFFWWFVQA
jgi:hypothetical protein